jgi:hypothetical protein
MCGSGSPKLTSHLQNLKHGVNLTILTNVCLGPTLYSDDGTPTPVILLSGCTEFQTNHKALGKGQDPFAHAIVSVIKNKNNRNHSIPTYTVLLHEAKALIGAAIRDQKLTSDAGKYLGPSTDETQPQPREESGKSNQDPQLLFSDGAVDVDSARFLCPLDKWMPVWEVGAVCGSEGNAIRGKDRRYPNDEYVSEELHRDEYD